MLLRIVLVRLMGILVGLALFSRLMRCLWGILWLG